jgi:hypothetical protein
VIVVSTAYKPPPEAKARCLESVAMQKGIEARHVYVDATEQTPVRSVSENLRSVIEDLPPHEVVAWVDGDDWLAHDSALAYVERAYQDPDVRLTYGSYECADGRPGLCAPYRTTDYRKEVWRASHLKTFRAGLFQRIKPEDLEFTLAVDQSVMLPMLEMAGPEHVRFIPQVLYIYNYVASYEHNATPEQLTAEHDAVVAIRSREPYGRLESL